MLQRGFHDRTEAGRQLAQRLAAYANRPDVIVLALPRGGVPVAAEIAARLHAPLDVFLVRKLGAPWHPELAIGAIAVGGVEVLSHDLIADLGIPAFVVQQIAERERLELNRRDREFRGDREPPAIRDRVVILVDDGLATGSTMEAAIVALRKSEPAQIVVAVPVGAPETCQRLGQMVDHLVCLSMPAAFSAVGQWYEDFSQTTDEEVRDLLAASRRGPGDTSPPHGSGGVALVKE